MREILFRGKHIHLSWKNKHLNGSWIYGFLCDKEYINSPKIQGEILIDHETICQYTGFDDKNETRIFEYDIIKFDDDGSEYFGKVVFEYGAFWIKWLNENSILRKELYFWATEREIEVIGNIFDNPDLLE